MYTGEKCNTYMTVKYIYIHFLPYIVIAIWDYYIKLAILYMAYTVAYAVRGWKDRHLFNYCT